MIVPDTSVWIEFLKQEREVTSRFLQLMKTRQIAVIEPVFAELLYGIRRPEDKELVLSYWQTLPRLEFPGGSMLDAARFANENNYHNSGVGLMDAAILKPVLDQSYKVWTLDKRILGILDPSNRFD